MGGEATEGVVGMQTVADLTHCQGYAQCMLLAAKVFELHREEWLLCSTAVPDELVERVRQPRRRVRWRRSSLVGK